jgi:hypothetical protein
MKITKARLKQIIVEELESVMNEEEEEEDTTAEEPVEEAYAGARVGPSHRDRPSYQAATVGGRVAGRSAGTPTLDAAAEALDLSPANFMLKLAAELDVDIDGAAAEEDAPLPIPEGE